jgi:glucose/arabinose dehydrogenase
VSSDPNLADPGSEQVLLGYGQPFRNHNGGGLAFGPDGYLYVGSGDGGSAGDPQGNGQRLDTLLGKVLRLAVSAGEYAIPPDNPFVNQAGARPEIWAYGLRNPWRLAFDGLTGGLYIADVGQNAWEEVNHQPANSAGGVNYGWNLLEGSQAYAGGGQDTTLPVAEYSHQNGCSVTGGVVMRDPGLPDWNGVYLYGDYCSGLIWGLLPATDGGWHNGLLFDTDFLLTGLGVGADGRVYLAHRDGEIYRLSPAQ